MDWPGPRPAPEALFPTKPPLQRQWGLRSLWRSCVFWPGCPGCCWHFFQCRLRKVIRLPLLRASTGGILRYCRFACLRTLRLNAFVLGAELFLWHLRLFLRRTRRVAAWVLGTFLCSWACRALCFWATFVGHSLGRWALFGGFVLFELQHVCQ